MDLTSTPPVSSSAQAGAQGANLALITSCGGDSFGATVPELVCARHLLDQGFSMSFVVRNAGRFAEAVRSLGVDVIERAYTANARSVLNRAARVLGTPGLAKTFHDADCVVAFRMSCTPLALGLGKRLDRPVMAYLHGYSDNKAKYLRYRTHEADMVLAVSQRAVDAYTRATEGKRSSEQPVELILNGIDDEAFRAKGAEMDARAAFSIPADAPLVGMAGADHRKGTDIFLNAAIRVAQDHPTAHFVVAGMFRDAEFEARLAKQAEAAGLGERMHWLGFQENVAAIMAASDVWTMPSRNDAFPLVGLEASASGTPLIASAIGGLPEMLVDGETGYLVPAEDVGALATRISELLGSDERRASMGEMGMRFVREKLSLDQQVQKFEQCIRDLIQRGRLTR